MQSEAAEEEAPRAEDGFDTDSTHYVKYLSGNRKSDFYRRCKSDRKQCDRLKNLMYSGGYAHLPAIPLVTGPDRSRKRIRFCVNVQCHEYPSYCCVCEKKNALAVNRTRVITATT